MITKQTAQDIALAYREIEVAEKLVADIKDAIDKRSIPDIRDAFGRVQNGLQLGVPSGDMSQRMFNLDYKLAVPIIEAHIAHSKSQISALALKAAAELADGGAS